MTDGDNKYGIIHGDSDDICPHDLDAERCPDCLVEIIQEIGTQLDNANDWIDELLNEVDVAEKLISEVHTVRTRLQSGITDPETMRASTLMLILLKEVFYAVDQCDLARRVSPRKKNGSAN